MTKTTTLTAALLASCAALGLARDETQPEIVAIGPYDIAHETLVTLAFLSFLDGGEVGVEPAEAWNTMSAEDRQIHLDFVLEELQGEPAKVTEMLPPDAILADRSNAAAEKAAADKAAADKAAAEKAAKAAKAEAKRLAKETAKAKAAVEPVHVVMRTSKYLGADGRSVARNRIARTSATRAEQLIAAGEARPATPAALAAAGDSIVDLA